MKVKINNTDFDFIREELDFEHKSELINDESTVICIYINGEDLKCSEIRSIFLDMNTITIYDKTDIKDVYNNVKYIFMRKIIDNNGSQICIYFAKDKGDV